MNARARQARATIRTRRRLNRALREYRRSRAAFQWTWDHYATDAMKRDYRAFMRQFALGDGIAFVPYDDPPLPRAGETNPFWDASNWAPQPETDSFDADTIGHAARLHRAYRVPSGLPPINGAYWMNEQEDGS